MDVMSRGLNEIRKKTDNCFGPNKSLFNLSEPVIRSYFCSITVAIIYMNIYIFKMSSDNDIHLGCLMFIILIMDNAGCLLEYLSKRAWIPLTICQMRVRELFRIVFLCLIPVLSLNQINASDIQLNFFCALILSMPSLYMIPYLLALFGRNAVYNFILKANFVLNAIVSFRTTFYGICASTLILTTWTAHRFRMSKAIFITRFLAVTFVYLTLKNVKVPKCDKLCDDKIDYCSPSDELCSFIRAQYYHKINCQ